MVCHTGSGLPGAASRLRIWVSADVASDYGLRPRAQDIVRLADRPTAPQSPAAPYCRSQQSRSKARLRESQDREVAHGSQQGAARPLPLRMGEMAGVVVGRATGSASGGGARAQSCK